MLPLINAALGRRFPLSIKVLYQGEDEHGYLQVTDDGEHRILAFAAYDEQSRCLTAAPHILQYDYTQAMLLVLLFCQPKRVLLLGLGGGSLMSSLHHAIPGIHINAVELRQQVIDIAYRYFQLPRGKRMQVIQQDASRYLRSKPQRKVDIIFTDLYHADGVDQAQLQQDFMQRCVAHLKTDGWFVINAWQEHRQQVAFIELLQQHFVDVRTLLTGSRNWVILAGRQQNTQTKQVLKTQAQAYADCLGFSLQHHLSRLKPM